MKTTFIVLMACTILYVVSAVPLRSDKKLARDAVSRILQSAKSVETAAEVQQWGKTTAKEDSFDELARKLTRAAASSENTAEIQFWGSLKDALKKATPYLRNAALNCLKDQLPSQIQGREKKAEEQHSFHFYEKEAAKRDQDKKVKEQHAAASLENAAEIQFWGSLLNAAKTIASDYLKSQLPSQIQGGEEKAEEQHSFQKEAARQDTARHHALDYFHKRLYPPPQGGEESVAATVQEGVKKVKEQHSFHFYDKMAAMEGLPAKLKAELLKAASNQVVSQSD